MIIAEENNQLKIENELISYRLHKGRPGSIRLSFDTEHQLKIETGNGKLGPFEINFLQKKSAWIVKNYRKIQAGSQNKSRFLKNIDKKILLFGKETDLEFKEGRQTAFHFRKDGIFEITSPGKYIEKHKKELIYHALREFSKLQLVKKTRQHAENCGIEINAVRVKDLSSKWGSCSSLKNINLNWQLIMLDQELIDYVIIHELMHTREMNHSKVFWKHVGQYFPDYKAARQKLKQEQWIIGSLK